MASARDLFPQVLESLCGRAAFPSGADAASLREAERLIDRGRAVSAQAPVPRAWVRRAARLIRGKPRPFALVFDSWFQSQPALRRASTAASPRFLRFEGPVTIDIEIAPGRRGATLLGQLDPVDAVREVGLEAGGRERRAKVGKDGTFRFGSVPPGRATLECGGTRLEDLPI